jgi:hypothetical protein
MLTISRPDGQDYLYKAISSLHHSVTNDDDVVGRVLVFHPRNSSTHQHLVFEKTKHEFESKQFIFEEKDCLNTTDYDGITSDKGIWRPVTTKDVQQNNDLIAMLAQVKSSFCQNENNLFMIMEDDFEHCTHSMHHFRRVLFAATLYYPNWVGIRVSYGLNGIILRCQHVNDIYQYMITSRFKGPADSLLGVFWDQLGKDESNAVFLTYQHNLLHHIGEVSSIVSGGLMTNRVYPGCYDVLQTGAVMEMFDAVKCYNKEFTPCKNPDMGPSILNVMGGNSQFDPRFQMKEKTSNIEIIKANSNEDCISACNRQSRTCARYMLPIINSCHVLNKYFSCKWCNEHEFYLEQSAHRNPLFLETTGSCWYGAVTTELRCEGAHPRTIRLCPCAN